MKFFRQFYVEFDVDLGFDANPQKVLGGFTAVGINYLGRVMFIEYRSKRRAYEYRVIDERGTELKIGIDVSVMKGWIHVSVPNESDVDPAKLAVEEILAEIIARPELSNFIKLEKGGSE